MRTLSRLMIAAGVPWHDRRGGGVLHFCRPGVGDHGAADASAREVVWSGAMPPSSVLDQLGQFLPRVEHPGLHGCSRDAEDLRALINRLLMVVNEVDDFPMFQR